MKKLTKEQKDGGPEGETDEGPGHYPSEENRTKKEIRQRIESIIK